MENTKQFSIFIFVLNLMFLLINSLFCQKTALALPSLVIIASSLLASSIIQLPKYLKCLTCFKGTPSNIILRCFSVLFIIIILVFLTLISIPYFLHVLCSLSIIFCIFFLLSATNSLLHHQHTYEL